MTQTILFYSNDITPRLRYTMESIVGNLLGLNFVFTQDKEPFVVANMPKINYSSERFSQNELFVESHDLLFDKTIKTYVIEKWGDFFSNKASDGVILNHPVTNFDTADFDFDVFARIFFLVSRYEEYNLDPSVSQFRISDFRFWQHLRLNPKSEIRNPNPSVLDDHGRFSSTKSVASKLDFLQQPLVNQYVITLSEKLKARFPDLDMSLPMYRFQPTFDIDNAWLYRNKGFLRNAGGFFKDILSGNFERVKNRADILRGVIDDPYFTFDYIQKLHQEYGFSPVVFWLLGDLGKYDKNISWKNKAFQELLRMLAKQYKVGIHPSYRSNDGVFILKKEVLRLAKILQNDASNTAQNNAQNPFYTEGSSFEKNRIFSFPSRQHFLKLRFPETYWLLLAVGVQADWTMGYADETGFRASIATPFPWFDLEKNLETPLIIHPFQAMDVTLKNYLNLTPEAATARLRTLIRTTRDVGGTFTPLWHNDNLSEIDGWEGWREVYERLLKDAI